MSDKDFKLEPEDFDGDNDYDYDYEKEEEEEEEEVLSLCDLAVNYSNDEPGCEDYYNYSKEDQDLFEFFSEKDNSTASSATNYPYNKDSIIFCGKLITFKEPLHPEKTTGANHQQHNTKKYSFSHLRTASTTSKLLSSKATTHQREEKKIFYNKLVLPSKCSDKLDLSVRKESPSSLSLRRWCLLAFGMARFIPVDQMELMRDIKARQSRQSSSAAVTTAEVMCRAGGGGRRRSEKGLWKLLGVLGCRSMHASAVVKGNN